MATCYRLALVGFFNGSDETRNIFTIATNAGQLPSDTGIDAFFNGLYTTTFLNEISNHWGSTRWILEEPVNGHWEYRKEKAFVKNGSFVTEPLPQQMAAVLIGVTASRRRAKKFIPGFTEAASNGGVLTGTAVSVLNTYGAAWLAGLTDNSINTAAGVCDSLGNNFTPLTAVRLDTILGTQRRRKQGVGS